MTSTMPTEKAESVTLSQKSDASISIDKVANKLAEGNKVLEERYLGFFGEFYSLDTAGMAVARTPKSYLEHSADENNNVYSFGLQANTTIADEKETYTISRNEPILKITVPINNNPRETPPSNLTKLVNQHDQDTKAQVLFIDGVLEVNPGVVELTQAGKKLLNSYLQTAPELNNESYEVRVLGILSTAIQKPIAWVNHQRNLIIPGERKPFTVTPVKQEDTFGESDIQFRYRTMPLINQEAQPIPGYARL